MQQPLIITWRKQKPKSGQTTPLLLQNLATASKDPRISLSRRYSSLPVPVSFLRTSWCQFQSVQAYSVKFKIGHGPRVRLRLRFLIFFKVALLTDVNNMAYRVILIMRFQQLEDIFSVGRTFACLAWHIVCGCKWRKSWWRVYCLHS